MSKLSISVYYYGYYYQQQHYYYPVGKGIQFIFGGGGAGGGGHGSLSNMGFIWKGIWLLERHQLGPLRGSHLGSFSVGLT